MCIIECTVGTAQHCAVHTVHSSTKGNCIIHNYNIINLPISWLCYASWIGIE